MWGRSQLRTAIDRNSLTHSACRLASDAWMLFRSKTPLYYIVTVNHRLAVGIEFEQIRKFATSISHYYY